MFDQPVSSSRVTKTIPVAVPGRCRPTTIPAARIRAPIAGFPEICRADEALRPQAFAQQGQGMGTQAMPQLAVIGDQAFSPRVGAGKATAASTGKGVGEKVALPGRAGRLGRHRRARPCGLPAMAGQALQGIRRRQDGQVVALQPGPGGQVGEIPVRPRPPADADPLRRPWRQALDLAQSQADRTIAVHTALPVAGRDIRRADDHPVPAGILDQLGRASRSPWAGC